MPSPIIHLAAGACVARRFIKTSRDRQNRGFIWASALFFSMAPDLDAIPGLLTGNLNAYHNEATHSLFFGAALCLLAALGIRRFLDGWTFSRVMGFVSLCFGLHLALDLMTLGPGLKLFWPLSDERFSLPVILFYGVRHSEGLFAFHHMITMVNELTLLAACYILTRLVSPLRFRNAGQSKTEP